MSRESSVPPITSGYSAPGLPPPSVGTASESGQSGLSFLSIEEVRDRGTKAHMASEQSKWSRNTPQTLSEQPTASEPPVSHENSEEETATSNNEADQPRLPEASNVENGTISNSISDSASWKDREINVEFVGNAICHSFIKSAFDGKYYLPLDQLCKLLAPDVVRKLLCQKFSVDKVASLEFQVLGTCVSDDKTSRLAPTRRRVFAILILIGEIERLRDFINAGIDDTDLPFKFEPKTGLCRLRPKTNILEPLKGFRHWPSRTAHNFFFYQGAIHVPFFKFSDEKTFFYNLNHDSILPFLRYDLEQVGGYASVKRVSIHLAHHDYGGNIPGQQPREFAVKRLHGQNAEDYFNEVRVFEKLGLAKKDSLPDHLIRLELTYLHGEDYFLMFPWADGNLKQFWGKETADPTSPSKVCWFFNQCWGITRGLQKIHHLSTLPKEALDIENAERIIRFLGAGNKEWGRHGDIKPENILWFKDYDERPKLSNHLVISDFGLTQFNTAHSRSKVGQEQIQGFSGTYRPPDLHLDDTISQKYDIWSLGCVFLELASWFLLGYEQGVKTFEKARVEDELETQTVKEDKFFGFIEGTGAEKPRNAAKVKDSVIKWIENLHQTEQCTEPLHAFLNLTQYTMLVPNSRHRWGCDRIRDELGELYNSCTKDEGYCVKGSSGKADPERYSCRCWQP